MNSIIKFSVVLLPILLTPTRAADASKLKSTTVKIVIPKTTVEFTLIQIPPGQIILKTKDGKSKTIDIKPIWIGKTEVTWDEYDVFCFALDLTGEEQKRILSQPSQSPDRERPKKPSYSPPDRGWGHDGFPACGVPIHWAQRYCEWLSKNTGHKYRLPTEAEWEYACRGNSISAKSEKAALKEIAWYAGNSEDQTHHVGEKKPNAFGLFDTLGNVAEWVIQQDNTPSVAGGSYKDEPDDLHPSAREPYNKSWQRDDPRDPKDRNWYINGAHVGFRIVREN